MSSHDRQRRAVTAAPAPRVRRPIQAKLEVGPVDDPLEVEAEATADRVITAIQTSGGATAVAARAQSLDDDEIQGGGPAKKAPMGAGAPENQATDQKTSSAGNQTGAPEAKNPSGGPGNRDEEEAKRSPIDAIHRAGAEEEEPLQGARAARSSAIGAEGGAVDPELEARLTAGGGAPLPEPVRATMETAFGADFSAVRISENPAAADIGALAYTTGADIRFAPGRFQPGSTEGQHLLAHELTHVVQQGASTARSVTQRQGGPVDPATLTVQDLIGKYHYQFRLFLRKNYAVENIDFLDALDHKMGREAMIKTFVSPDAPMSINVSSDLRDSVMGGADPEILRGEIMHGLASQVVPFTNDPEAVATLSL
jgi:Domain of unknown function (DUF4157)